MSQQSRPDPSAGKDAQGPTLESRVAFLEAYFRDLHEPTYRPIDAGFGPPPGMRATSGLVGGNKLSPTVAPCIRPRLDNLLTNLVRLNGHLDVLNNYVAPETAGATASNALDTPEPFGILDKIDLANSRLDYALLRTEALLNRF